MWAWLGTACGAGLGFITANVPGLVVGAGAGNRLGAIRDAKGKSVAAVFEDFSSAQKAEVRRKVMCGTQCDPSADMLDRQILRVLALKVLGAAYS